MLAWWKLGALGTGLGSAACGARVGATCLAAVTCSSMLALRGVRGRWRVACLLVGGVGAGSRLGMCSIGPSTTVGGALLLAWGARGWLGGLRVIGGTRGGGVSTT